MDYYTGIVMIYIRVNWLYQRTTRFVSGCYLGHTIRLKAAIGVASGCMNGFVRAFGGRVCRRMHRSTRVVARSASDPNRISAVVRVYHWRLIHLSALVR